MRAQQPHISIDMSSKDILHRLLCRWVLLEAKIWFQQCRHRPLWGASRSLAWIDRPVERDGGLQPTRTLGNRYNTLPDSFYSDPLDLVAFGCLGCFTTRDGRFLFPGPKFR